MYRDNMTGKGALTTEQMVSIDKHDDMIQNALKWQEFSEAEQERAPRKRRRFGLSSILGVFTG